MSREAAVRLRSRPTEMDLVPESTAVVVVDMQNGFVSPGGSWSLGGVDIGPIEALVPTIATVLDAARQAAIPVVYLTAPLPASPDPDVIPTAAYGGTGHERWRHYVASTATGRSPAVPCDAPPSPTWNTDVVSALAPHADDLVVVKPTFGGFHGTDLERELRRGGIDTLLLTGCTTSVCVETTLREGQARGFNCVLIEDCVAEPVGGTEARTNHDATIHVTELLFGWVTDSTKVVDSLTAARAKQSAPNAYRAHTERAAHP